MSSAPGFSQGAASPSEGLGSAIMALVGIGSLAGAVVLYKCRQRCARHRHDYERVAHELDAEERDFKRALEGRAGDDCLVDDDDDFSDAETAELEMIDSNEYRRSTRDDGDDDEEAQRLTSSKRE